MPISTLPRRRIPAVSIRVIFWPSQTNSVSMASRVVPGMALTMERSTCSSALSSDDLPTLGRPTIAMRTESAGGCSSTTGTSATIASSRSPVPVPCKAEIGYTLPRLSSKNSNAACLRASLSALLAARITGRPERRKISATSRSAAVTPSLASTKKTTASASVIATSACWRISRTKSREDEPKDSGWCPFWGAFSVAATSSPPVSTRMNG